MSVCVHYCTDRDRINEVCLSMGNNESEDEAVCRKSNALSNALNEGREWTKQE